MKEISRRLKVVAINPICEVIYCEDREGVNCCSLILPPVIRPYKV